jgi:exodeoxyribonuclease VII large subunit
MRRPAPDGESEARILTVSELNESVRVLLEDAYRDVWVEGEISNFHAHRSGHFYFSLKDSRGQIAAVMFRGRNRSLRFQPEDGLLVVARATVSLYPPRGTFQLIVDTMEPRGIGALQLAFEQLKARLQSEGLFDPAKKMPLPALPRRIGVITSPTGAAVRDILNVLGRRHADLQISIFPTAVQGDGAAPQIAAALAAMNRLGRHDVLIVARGGGSLEDLWAFNTEEVARAIAASRIPVVSAVGHEIDFTIADFVADLRAPTPSAAAEMVVESKQALLERLDSVTARLRNSIRLGVAELRHRIEALAGHRAFRGVEARIADAHQRFDESVLRLRHGWRDRQHRLHNRLDRAATALGPERIRAMMDRRRHRRETAREALRNRARQAIRDRQTRLGVLGGRLESLSPIAVLARGYAICRDPASGRVFTRAADTKPGGRVEVQLHRGRLGCEIKEVRS